MDFPWISRVLPGQRPYSVPIESRLVTPKSMCLPGSCLVVKGRSWCNCQGGAQRLVDDHERTHGLPPGVAARRGGSSWLSRLRA